MRFRVGQDVYVGWTPDHKTGKRARVANVRCRVGVIHSGPFKRTWPMSDRWWKVTIDGVMCSAVECILFPFDNPTTETATEQHLEATE